MVNGANDIVNPSALEDSWPAPHRRHAGAGGVEGQDRSMKRFHTSGYAGVDNPLSLQGEQPQAAWRCQEDAGRGAGYASRADGHNRPIKYDRAGFFQHGFHIR